MFRITLEAARVNAGFTQKEAAKRLKVSNKTIGNWENGVSFPNVKKVEELCELYKIPYDNLIFLSQKSALSAIKGGNTNNDRFSNSEQPAP